MAVKNGVVGAHSFGEQAAVFDLETGILAVDGERSVYHDAGSWELRGLHRWFRVGAHLELTGECRGNLAYFCKSTGAVYLATEWTGTFPLYYYSVPGGGFAFSSLLQTLARAVDASTDDLGILQFLRQAYTYNGRTQFQGIFRLQPGQVLRFRDGQVEVQERSEAWTQFGLEGAVSEMPSIAYSLLGESFARAYSGGARGALMMSAGWDSRTLLAAAAATLGSGALQAYSHGDTESRELRIVRRLCSRMTTPLDLEPIDDRVWDLDALNRSFARTENVVFPHWHRAGMLLAERGVDWISAGVYGEVLGGHYGSAMLGSPAARAMRLAASLLGSPRISNPSPRELLRVGKLGRHWYLRRDYEESIASPTQAMNAEIDAAILRIEERGVPSAAQVIEAFISEHRGSQYINAQLMSCRANCDVVLPFADRELLRFAARIPFPAKIHNRLNRSILRHHAPALLEFPLAATLLPAGAPLVAQEASRVARSLYENGRQRLHIASRGQLPAPRLGWVNFDFLASGVALNSLIDDLRCDIWNYDALRQQAQWIMEGNRRMPLHPMYDQMSKIYTVDLLLRHQ